MSQFEETSPLKQRRVGRKKNGMLPDSGRRARRWRCMVTGQTDRRDEAAWGCLGRLPLRTYWYVKMTEPAGVDGPREPTPTWLPGLSRSACYSDCAGGFSVTRRPAMPHRRGFTRCTTDGIGKVSAELHCTAL